MEILRFVQSYNKHFVNYHYLCGFKTSLTESVVEDILKPTTLTFSDVMIDGTKIMVRSAVVSDIKQLLEKHGFTVVIDCE